MIKPAITPAFRLSAAALSLALLSACGSLLPTPADQPQRYALDQARLSTAPTPAPAPKQGPTLIVNPPRAASGFDSQRINYVRQPHLLEYYAQSEWVDTPARMLAPLIVSAIENTGAFRAVILTPSAATGELRLHTEIIRLQHDLSAQPGRVVFTLRAYLVDTTSRQVIASREFNETVIASSETPYAGVVAANLAVQAGLEKLAIFCQEIALNLRSTAPRSKYPRGVAMQISGDSVQIARPVEQARSRRVVAEGCAIMQNVVAKQAHARLELRLKDVRCAVLIQQAFQRSDGS